MEDNEVKVTENEEEIKQDWSKTAIGIETPLNLIIDYINVINQRLCDVERKNKELEKISTTFNNFFKINNTKDKE